MEKTRHLGLKDLIRLSLRIFRTNPLRTFLTILGMDVGISVVVFLVSLGYGMQYILIGKMVKTEESLYAIEASYPFESEKILTNEDIERIRKITDVKVVSPLAEFPGEVSYKENNAYVMIALIDSNYFRLSGDIPSIGKEITHKDEAVISSTALKLLNLPGTADVLNADVSVKVSYSEDKEKGSLNINSLKIKGIIVDEYSPPFILLSLDSVSVKPPYYKKIYILAKDLESLEALKDKIIEQGFLISTKLDLVRQAKRIMTIITIILGIFGMTSLVVAGIGMFNTMVVSFLTRIFEIGIMKSMGATDKDVRNLFLAESVIMSLLGGLGGIGLGILGGEGVNLGLRLLASYLGGEPVRIVMYPWQFLGIVIIVSIIVGILAGLGPARRASQLSPKEAFLQR
jgi:putative ABC transport system permease protein